MDTNNFTNKPQFKIMWKNIFNDKKTKPKMVEKNIGRDIYKVKEKGWLIAEHFILFNVFMNKPIHIGFIPESEGFKNSLKKLQNENIHLNRFYLKELHLPFSNYILFEDFTKLIQNTSFE